MCKYCEDEFGVVEIDTVNFSLGVAGEMQAELYLHSYPYYHNYIAELSVAVSAVEGDTVVSHDISINYCPFCGRDLAALRI